MQKEFTCKVCDKKFMDEALGEIEEKARMFSLCLECGKQYQKLRDMHSN